MNVEIRDIRDEMCLSKLLIFGLDGLDYDCVLKWDLKHLKQEEYNLIEVPINEKTGYPISPQVWGSFLTGKMIESAEFNRVGIFGKIMHLLEYLNKITNIKIGIGKMISKKTYISYPKLSFKTFLDFPKVAEINAPFYSFDEQTLKLFSQWIYNKKPINTMLKELYSIYDQRKEDILIKLENLIENNEVIFIFMHYPDILQHFLFLHKDEIKKMYINLDDFISTIKKDFDYENIYIVSDHGFNFTKGTHTNYGFFSSNKKMRPKPKVIIDFYEIIKKTVNV